jgi:hypothetical protein
MDITIDYVLEKYKHRTFYLYHIKGKKWGCAMDIDKRLKKQGYTIEDTEEVKEVIGIQVADRLEKLLNEREGYPYNHTQAYIRSLLNFNKASQKSPQNGAPNNTNRLGKRHSKRTKKQIGNTVKKKYASGEFNPKRHKGSANGNSKYTAEQARFVKQHYFKQKNQFDIPPKGKLTVKEIQEKIGVSYKFIKHVTNGLTWKHINP